MKTSPLVIRSAIIAALGGFLFGFDTAVISGTTDALRDVFQLDGWWLGFTVAAALIGTILGAGCIQYPSNHYGRKKTLIVMAVFYFISAVGSAFPWNWYSFLFFRFLGGIAVGGASVVSPLYTAEISPAKTRGVLVAITQFNIVVGILIAFFSNYLISEMGVLTASKTPWIASSATYLTTQMGMGENAWRWMFGVEALPAALFFLLLFIVPESPRWLISRGRVAEAKPILAALGTDSGDVETEVRIIENALVEERAGGHERFFCWRFRYPIMLAICIAAFNQLSGINAVLYYAPEVFRLTGVTKQAAMFFPVIIGLTNLVFTMAAMFVIDWFGRRKLMFAGSVGYILSLSVVAAAFVVYGPQFNLSINTLALEKADENVEKVEKKLAEPLTESEKTFWETELKAAQKDRAEAQQKLKDAAVFNMAKNAAEAGESGVKPAENAVQPAADTAVVKSVVPAGGIYMVLGGLMVFIAAHAFGQGACIWVFIGEIFPNNVRAQGQALGSFTHWIFAAAITQLFPFMLEKTGPALVFFLFAGMMVLQLLWVIFLMPETKQVPLEEMQKKLGIE